MEFTPNSKIYFLKDVPFDPSYINTGYWRTLSQQITYFQSKIKQIPYNDGTYEQSLGFTNQSYQRYNKNTIRINIGVESLYDCNYLMFQNTNYTARTTPDIDKPATGATAKWFFAFILDVTYVNDNCTEVSYAIDVIQTWFFEMNLQDSFIVRQHATDDTIGHNVQDEGLELGDYMIRGAFQLFSDTFSDNGYILVATQLPTIPATFNYSVVGSLQCGLTLLHYSNANAINAELQLYNNNGLGNAIIALYSCPNNFVLGTPPVADIWRETEIAPIASSDFATFKYTYGNTTYACHNNKLRTFPFCMITFTNQEGDSVNLRPERFSNLDNAQFKLYGAIYPTPEAWCVPLNYSGYAENMQYGLFMRNFPQCGTASDSYSAWLAQNINSLQTSALIDWTKNGVAINQGARQAALNTIAGAIGGAISGASQGAQAGDGIISDIIAGGAGAILGGIGGGAKPLAQWAIDQQRLKENQYWDWQADQNMIIAAKKDHQAVPATEGAKAGVNSVIFEAGKKYFMLYEESISAEYAKIIDQYFDMYGYAMNKVDTPNLCARKYWTYVKTLACALSGDMPTTHAETIQNLFNNGLRFWNMYNIINDNKTIGDYTGLGSLNVII